MKNCIHQPTVAYLGPEASFTHIAAQGFFGNEGLIAYSTIPDCIEAVADGRAIYAVVPLENALEGSVPLTIDYLFHSSDLYINAELSTPIQQHLLIHPEQEKNLDLLESIHSHPHALAQCHKFLQYHYRKVPLIQTTSTAAAAKYVSEHPQEKIAAIGNQLAANTYGLSIAESSIHDFHFNHTRFVVLSSQKESLVLENRGLMKTTLMVKLPEDDQPGMLHQILSVFAWRKLNLSKIESRPLKTGLGNYFFIIDVLENETNPLMIGAIEELHSLSCEVTLFGSYFVYDYSLPADY